MIRTRISVACIMIMAVGLSAVAQEGEPEWRTASGIYQEDFEYQIGNVLNPRVIIDGLRWNMFSVELKKKSAQIEPDKSIDIIVKVGFENTSSDKLKVAVILMLENAEGHKVGTPINLSEERIGKGDAKVFEQKHEVDGSALLATGRIYLFCEVSS